MPNEVCSSYRSPLIGGTLQLHSTHSRISLSLLTCNMWGIKTDKIQNHSFDSQPQTHDPVLNSLHLNTIHMPFLQTSVISCLIYTWSTAHTACLPPFSPAYQPAQSQLPVTVVPCSHPHIPAFSSISFTLNMPPPFSLVFGTQ